MYRARAGASALFLFQVVGLPMHAYRPQKEDDGMTDRELDVQIAEYVFSIKKIFQPRDFKRAEDAFWGTDEYSFIPSGKSPRTHMIDARPVPHFSTDISCAMQILDKADGLWELSRYPDRPDDAPDDTPYALHYSCCLRFGNKTVCAVADTKEKAICYAALAAYK